MLHHKESRSDRRGQIITVNHSAIHFSTPPSGTAGVSWRRGLSLPRCQRDCSFISSRICCLSCLGRGLSLQIYHRTQAPRAETLKIPRCHPDNGGADHLKITKTLWLKLAKAWSSLGNEQRIKAVMR